MSRSRSQPVHSAVSNAVDEDAHCPSSFNLRLVLALVWFVAFCMWFYSFGLPNNRPAERWMVWQLLPFDLLDLLDPPLVPNAAPWSWLYLGQRVPFLAVAAFVWLAALCAGRLELRVLRLCAVLSRSERFFFAGCLGLATVSLVMLGLGLLGAMSRWLLLTALVGVTLAESVLFWRDVGGAKSSRPTNKPPHESGGCEDLAHPTRKLPWAVLVIVVPFVFCMLLGAMSPQTDFDVIEYHLGGPKEWFQQGRIARLPHNVYTSFPFLTEMLLLCGMVLYGDWEWGALAGQAVIAGFALLTAVGLYATGKRWFSSTAGWLAALVWLTTPWVYRISIIAYAEGGLACYLFAALAVGLRLVFLGGGRESPGSSTADNSIQNRGAHVPRSDEMPSDRAGKLANPFVVLCGLLAGSAMSCKYTGAVCVVVPLGLLIVWNAAIGRAKLADRVKSVFIHGGVFTAGVLIAVGPWLLKNVVETGNPVYPLAYSIFDGAGRDATMDAQWQAAHGPRHYASLGARLRDLPVKLTDVVANNDWHSALMFGLAPIALLASWRRRVWCVWAFLGWQFFSWWLFTHHIDRFYVPMFSAVALLAGAGAAWLASNRIGRWCGGTLVAASVLFNSWIMLKVGGFNAGRTELAAARDLVVSPTLKWLNDESIAGRMPRDMKILCVGEAALFHARFPYVYNTVFDRSLFEQWFTERTGSGGLRPRPADDIRATLRRYGITHVLVNWSEILRYREPGSYGYTDFAHPGRFDELQTAKVLGPPLLLPSRATFAPASVERRKQIEAWAPSLLMTVQDEAAFIAVQVFPVKL